MKKSLCNAPNEGFDDGAFSPMSQGSDKPPLGLGSTILIMLSRLGHVGPSASSRE